MNSKLVVIATGLVACLAAGTRVFAEEPPKLSLEPVRGSIHAIMGSGGNMGVFVGDDGVLLIDDKFAPLNEAILAHIRTLSSRPVRFLVNTHWHMDHTGGNENFGKAGAVIIAHENIRKRLSTDQFIKAFKKKVPALSKDGLPVVTFDDDVKLHFNGDTMHVVHVPHAHTDGDAIIRWEKSNVIHAGDVVFSSGYPFIDLSSGGSIDGMIAGVKTILSLADEKTRIIPGHGPVISRAELVEYQTMLTSIHDAVEAQLKKGATAKAILASGVTKPFDKKWGKGFMKPDTFLGIVIDSLTSK